MHKTQEETDAQKRMWADNHNAARRKKYRDDAQYRDKVVSRQQAMYRSDKNIKFLDCRENIPILNSFGEVRELLGGGREMTFTFKEAANALGGYTIQIVRGWARNGQLPAPIESAEVELTTARRSYTKDQEVYTYHQMIAIMSVLGEFQTQRRYFRQTDTEVIMRIKEAFIEVIA